MVEFDDARLEDREQLAYDTTLRELASAGARVRRDLERGSAALAGFTCDRPRAVIAAGTEARLLRAMLEPTCPVPFVAWSTPGLPGWVGPLDLVVITAPEGGAPALLATIVEAVRRGATLLVVGPDPSPVADACHGRATTHLPTATDDPLAAATLALAALAQIGLGPAVFPERLADALDAVAEECSPFVDLSQNRAKELALAFADTTPLLWGGSVLAARAARRVAESLRTASGRPALAAEAPALTALLAAVEQRDLFADPFEDPSAERAPSLVVLDDGRAEEPTEAAGRALASLAESRSVRVSRLAHVRDDELTRYAALLQAGNYAAAYVGIGLGRSSR